MHVLSDFEHHDRETAVLAHRQPLGRGNLVIPYELLERPSSKIRLLATNRIAKRLQDVGGNVVVGLDDQPRDRVAQHGHFNMADCARRT